MIETERLILRGWGEEDRAPYIAMMADPRVMATLGPVMTPAEADAKIDNHNRALAEHGVTRFAVERRADGVFLGYCGPRRVQFDCPVKDEYEIGWGLANEHWGLGYATEAARAVKSWAAEQGNISRLFSFTTPTNHRSQALMQRIAMVRRPELDFDHPHLDRDDPLRPHMVYALELSLPSGKL